MRSHKTRLAVAASACVLSLGAAAPTFANHTTQVTQGTLIAALNNINVEIQNLQALNNVTIGDVTVVDIDNVANNNRVLNNALNRNQVDINVLRDFLNNSNVLNDANIVVTDVVAIDVLSGGDVIVFTR